MTETPNLDYFNAIAAGDATLLNRLIHIAKEEFPNIFGLDKGYSIAARFENELHQKETHSYSEFLGILDRIETYLTVI